MIANTYAGYKKHIQSILKSSGFKGSGNNFTKKFINGSQIMSLQKSNYSQQFTINFGIHYNFIPSFIKMKFIDEPTSYFDCHFDTRPRDGQNNNIWIDPENPDIELMNRTIQNIMERLDDWTNIEHVITLFENGDKRYIHFDYTYRMFFLIYFYAFVKDFKSVEKITHQIEKEKESFNEHTLNLYNLALQTINNY
jgi:hypothetical protein